MNVDEAMELFGPSKKKFWTLQSGDHFSAGETLACEVERLRAEVQRLDIAGIHSCHDDCQKLPCVQRREIDRLRAELAQSRKDWCDDDEAIKQQALRVLDAAKVEGDSVYVPRMGALAEMMADELVKVRAELAEAKAASACPVKVSSIWEGTYQSDRYIELRTDAEADTFTDWLRQRMKDKSPPQA